MISAQAETAREARSKAEKEDDEEDRAEALAEAEKAKEREKELRIQAKKGMPKEGPRLRLDKAAGHPPRLCKDKEKARKRAAYCQRFSGRAKRAEQRQKKDVQWHEAHDKLGTGKYAVDP